MFTLILLKLSDTHNPTWKIKADYYRTVPLLSITTYLLLSTCKIPIIFVRFYQKCVSSTGFSKTDPMSIFTKILPARTDLFHEDGRMDVSDGVTSNF